MATAPSEDDFLRVLKDFRNGKSNGDDGVHDCAKRKKLRRMKFCLAEALRVRTHIALRQAAALTLHSDESKGYLILRGQMCGEDLCPQHLLLGTVHLASRFESSGIGIASGVVTCLRELATPLLGAPFTATAADEPEDTELLLHMCNIVEVFNADAAYSEQLAGKLLQKGNQDANDAELQLARVFPNMVVVGQDKPHGARRHDTPTPTHPHPTATY